jgi:hypothetical protein
MADLLLGDNILRQVAFKMDESRIQNHGFFSFFYVDIIAIYLQTSNTLCINLRLS